MPYNRFEQFPEEHFVITPSDTVDLVDHCLVYAGTAGNIAAADNHGTEVIYTVTAGSTLPVVVQRVKATGTTVTQIIGLR